MAEDLFECLDCGRQFPKEKELDQHVEEEHPLVRTVRKDPLVLTVDVPEDCTPGSMEAAESFAESAAELRERFPGRRFQFVPFMADASSRSEVGFTSWLAIAE